MTGAGDGFFLIAEFVMINILKEIPVSYVRVKTTGWGLLIVTTRPKGDQSVVAVCR